MPVLVVIAVLTVLAAIVVGCDDGVPSSESGPSVQTQQNVAAQERQQTQPQEQAAAAHVEAQAVVASQQDRTEDDPEPERRAEQADEAMSEVDAEEPEPEVEEPLRDLTDVPATVVEDADVRVRPGLAWPVMERLGVGERVTVLNAAGSWYRIAYGDNRSGWMRASGIDLGEVERRSILERQAPLIIVEWQGVEYGVMGQSADGAEVRLLSGGEQMASAPKDEVTLLADDLTLDDLPVLVGDETVVFPGDDFRVGLGKILPKANEWMWLPWGWLLAHNDEYIWQWRPESDELELIRRPPGIARLSPDGRHLAVIEYEDYEGGDYDFVDLHVIPLNGSRPWSLRDLVSRSANGGGVEQRLAYTPNHLLWSANGRSVLLTHQLRHDALSIAAVYLHPNSGARLLTFQDGPECHVNPWYPWRPPIRLRSSEETIVGVGVYCDESVGHHAGYLVYDEDGEFDRLVPLRDVEAEHGQDLELLRSAQFGGQLGDEFTVLWSPSRQRALIVDYAVEDLWLYEADRHQLRQVMYEGDLLHVSSSRNLSVVRWDGYWQGDSRVAVLARLGYDWILRTLLIDTDTAIAVSFERGGIARWPCLGTGSWRADGELFLSIYAAYVGWSEEDEGRWIDGLSVTNDALGQLVINRADGSLAGMLRMPTWKWGPPSVVGHWSPSGEWLAIGGHRQPGQCVFGS